MMSKLVTNPLSSRKAVMTRGIPARKDCAHHLLNLYFLKTSFLCLSFNSRCVLISIKFEGDGYFLKRSLFYSSLVRNYLRIECMIDTIYFSTVHKLNLPKLTSEHTDVLAVLIHWLLRSWWTAWFICCQECLNFSPPVKRFLYPMWQRFKVIMLLVCFVFAQVNGSLVLDRKNIPLSFVVERSIHDFRQNPSPCNHVRLRRSWSRNYRFFLKKKHLWKTFIPMKWRPSQ